MTIQDDVLKLYKSGAKRVVLADINSRPSIPAKIGVGKAAENSAGTVSIVKTEVISVYSKLIITEDGAFERPAGWPTNGAYPSGTAIPSPLPASLINDAGVLKLDINVQHYEQKRVHLAAFDADDGLNEFHYLVKLAAPYDASGYYQGITRHASGPFSPALYRDNATAGLSTAAADKLSELDGLGIVNE